MNTSMTGFLRLTTTLCTLLASTVSFAAQFSPMDAIEFQADLITAQNNGQDDVFNLANITYNVASSLTYEPTEDHDLTILGGGPSNTILDGGDSTQILNFNLQGAPNNTTVLLTLAGLTIQNGFTDGGAGPGAEIFPETADIIVTDCELLDNRAINSGGSSGGALISNSSGDINIENCRIQNNFANDGGAGLELLSSTGTISVTNNLITDNETNPNQMNSVGGGLRIFNFGGPIELTHNTIYNNLGLDGGGVHALLGNNASFTATNNIIFGNRADDQGDDIYLRDDHNNDLQGESIIMANNLFASLFSECTDKPACMPDISETNSINMDPLFVDANNDDYQLQLGSPARNAGTTQGILLPSEDLDSHPRIIGSAPDLGALENTEPAVDSETNTDSETTADTESNDNNSTTTTNSGGCKLNGSSANTPLEFLLMTMALLALIARRRTVTS